MFLSHCEREGCEEEREGGVMNMNEEWFGVCNK